MKTHRFVFTGGGTGGHVYPNIAIYEALKEKFPAAEFLYLGTRTGAENRIIATLPQPLPFRAIRARGLPQPLRSWRSLPALCQLLAGTAQSLFILRRFKPDLIIASGGYVAAPVLAAAALLKIRSFVHEQNAVPGRLNRASARFATRIGITYPSTAAFFPAEKVVLTGYPLRCAILAAGGESAHSARSARSKFAIPEKNKVLFICSGSTGARTVNRAAAAVIPQLLAMDDLTVILSTGRSYSREYKAYDDTVTRLQDAGCASDIEGRLIIREYFDRIEEIYACADLVVARAGAGSIKEIAARRLPAILIPKSDLPGDHQIHNAKEVEKLGGARIIYEEVVPGEGGKEIVVPAAELLAAIGSLIHDEAALAAMRARLEQEERSHPAAAIVDEIAAIVRQREEPPEKELKTFYLQSPTAEKNFELLFNPTTIGNALLADIYLENLSHHALCEIKFLQRDTQIVLRRIHGAVTLNGTTVAGVTELHENDRLAIEDQEYILKTHIEKIMEADFEKPTAAKVLGSSLGILVSRLGGFIREVFTAAIFGAGRAMDIFSVGLTLSNFMRRIVAENALENAFLPIYLRIFHRGSRKKTWEAASSITNFTLLLAVTATVVGILLAPLIIRILFPGFVSKGFFDETTVMTRLMFPYLTLVTIAAIMTTYLKAFNRFGIAESSALFFSVGSVLGMVLLLRLAGNYALAYGILLGGVLQILFLLPFLCRLFKSKSLEFAYRPRIKFASTVNKKYYSQLAPISVDVTLSQVSTVVDKFLASSLATGSLSYLYYAMEIFRLPFALISQAVSSVVLKEFSENIALFHKEKARKLFTDGVKINFFLLTPISILMIILARPIVSLLLERFNFNAAAVTNTALALQFYSIGLIGWGIHILTTRIFSARMDIKTSVTLNFFMLACNITLCITLVRTPLKFAGIALATSISFLLFSFIRILVLKAKLEREDMRITYHEFFDSIAKTLTAAILMVIAMVEAKFIFNRVHFSSRLLENLILLVGLSFVGASIYFLSSLMLKNSDVLLFRRKASRRRAEVPLAALPPFRFFERVSRDPDRYRDEYRYKISQYLASDRWEIRNVGIKLIGLFRDEAKAEFLIALLATPESNGFLRRNAVTAIGRLGIWNDKSKRLLLEALHDPYYEVRVAALDILARRLEPADYPSLAPRLRRLLSKGMVEEKLAGLRLLAELGTEADMAALEKLYLTSNSLLREGVVDVLRRFWQRGILAEADVRHHLHRILITSNHYSPEFKIKSAINRILEEMEEP